MNSYQRRKRRRLLIFSMKKLAIASLASSKGALQMAESMGKLNSTFRKLSNLPEQTIVRKVVNE